MSQTSGNEWSYDFAQPHPRLLGKTVYILGSGFSKPMGLPVIADFLPEGLRMLKETAWAHPKSSVKRNPRQRACETSIQQVQAVMARYDPMLRSLGIMQPTLEDIFCAVDLLDSLPAKADSGETARDSLHTFVRLVCEIGWRRHLDQIESLRKSVGNDQYTPTVPHLHFRSHARPVAGPQKKGAKPAGPSLPEAGRLIDPRKQNVCAYEAFLSQIVADDSEIQCPKVIPPDLGSSAIISLNYDRVIEKKAETFGKENLSLFYGRNVVKEVREDELFQCLRLAVDFAEDRPVILPLIKLHGSINWSKADRSNEAVIVHGGKLPSTPQLIFPTWQRDPIERTIFGRLLAEARVHLRLASRIVFIGYSMPPTDRYFRYLLADALSTPDLPEIVICNRWSEAEARTHCETMLGRGVTEARLKVYYDFLEYVGTRREPQVLET